jgi:hypothetical protein
MVFGVKIFMQTYKTRMWINLELVRRLSPNQISFRSFIKSAGGQTHKLPSRGFWCRYSRLASSQSSPAPKRSFIRTLRHNTLGPLVRIIRGTGTAKSAPPPHPLRPQLILPSFAHLRSSIFWDTTPCSPLKVNRRFGRTYRLHLQGRRIRRARNQRESRWQAQTRKMETLILGNVGWLSTDYTALYPRI